MIQTWNRSIDNGAVHAFGNGQMLVYSIGPEISQIIGPHYSAESLGSLTLPDIASCKSERLPKTAIWRHWLDNGAMVTDLVDSESVCFLREIETCSTFRMVLDVSNSFSVKKHGPYYGFHASNGYQVFFYRSSSPLEYYLGVNGDALMFTQSEHQIELTIQPGKCRIAFSNSIDVLDTCLYSPFTQIVERTSLFWNSFLAQGRPVPPSLAAVCENVAVMIKSQQSSDGGVIAGYPFHLAYIRDQYGVARGMLKMGFYAEAKAILEYYWQIWNQYGVLHNAQSVGEHGIFHVHENDKVEITGYLAIFPFDLYRAGEDKELLMRVMPMIQWALDQQLEELKNNMLPFNGDETYIAGGFLPRAVMYDGSAEATMLFAEGIRRYQEFTGDMKYETAYQKILDTYTDNFIHQGQYITNRPGRISFSEYPLERHGVCECCNSVLTRLVKDKNHRYICSDCLRTDPLPVWDQKIYALAASRLTPIYIGAAVVPDSVLSSALDDMVSTYFRTGEMPSGCPHGECVGYDYGMLLYGLVHYHHPAAESMYNLMMSVLDETGVWCEYYKDNIARSTRCRPWESAINIEAALSYLEWVAE